MFNDDIQCYWNKNNFYYVLNIISTGVVVILSFYATFSMLGSIFTGIGELILSVLTKGMNKEINIVSNSVTLIFYLTIYLCVSAHYCLLMLLNQSEA